MHGSEEMVKKKCTHYIGKFSCFPANECPPLIYCVAHENNILCPETLQGN